MSTSATSQNRKTIYDNRLLTHTVWGQTLMTANALGIEYPVLQHTTLNELYRVQENARLERHERPRIGYYCIGMGGHGTSSFNFNGKTFAKPDLYKHDPKDAGLYEPIPFVLRRTNNDLTPEERANYGLRVKRDFNGVEYFAYYAKRINTSTSEIRILQDTVVNGKLTSVPYVPDSSNLSPARPTLSPRGVVVASNEKLRNNLEISINFTAEDARNLLEVGRILFDGNEDATIISEIALCSGVDRIVTGQGGGNQPIQYNEILACQVAAFITTHKHMPDNNAGFEIFFDMGSRVSMTTSLGLDTTAIYTP